MIIIYHQNNKIVEIKQDEKNIVLLQVSIAKTLFNIAASYPKELLIWCHTDFKSNLNFSELQNIFHHRKIMTSYNAHQNSFLSDAIGYVEESPFIKINKDVTFPTWQISSCVGGIYAEVLLAVNNEIKKDNNFDYFLHSMAKTAMPRGLFCYSEPGLLTKVSNPIKKNKNDYYTLFRFVKQHYKVRWVFLLFLNLFLYEGKLSVLPFFYCFFYPKRELKNNIFDNIAVQSVRKVVEAKTIDVIIPTIGRKQYLYDVLKDLSGQTHLPENVIIVEQNPNLTCISELDYITHENWPFAIEHIFTHQTGACNARNLALKEIKSEWVFMADDDIRFKNYFLEKAFEQIKLSGIKAATFNCFQKNEKLVFKKIFQWSTFGSGCSIIQHQVVKNMLFNMKFEFGFGEDADFGMELRNHGIDVLYFPEPGILHLKAPIGGFRTKPVLPWHTDKIQPKPSPSVMLYKQLHLSKQQLKGYKTILFFKFYRVQVAKNPVQYFVNFKKKWKQSEYWANELGKR